MIERDYCETDLTGEIEEARQLRHQHLCEMRDIEQGIQPACDEHDGAFMYYNGRRVEWQMVHPALREIFAFNVHGPSLCIDCEINPQFPNDMEVAFLERTIREMEEALV